MNLKKLFLFLFIITVTLTSGQVSSAQNFKKLTIDRKCDYFIGISNEERKEIYQSFENELLNIDKKKLNKKNLLNLNLSQGLIEKFKGNNVQSILRINEVLIEDAQNILPKHLLVVYLSLYESYLELNIFSKVIETNAKIEELSKMNVSIPLWDYNLKSKLYFKMEKFKEATTQLEKEIELLKKNPLRDSLIVPSATNDLGLYYYVINDFNKSEYNFNKSIQLAKHSLDTLSNNYKELYFTIQNNLARLKVKQSKNDDAIKIITKNVFPKISSESELYTEASYILANAQLNNREFTNFKKTQLYNAKHQDDHPNYKYQFLSFEIIHFTLIGKYKEALKLQKELYTLRTSEIKSKNSKQSKSQEINYLLIENENTIRKKNNELEERYTKIMIFIIVFFALTIIIISYLYISILKRKRQIEKMNIAISNQKNEIEHSLKEKEILLKEVHHRVKNNLQIISSILDLQLLSTNNTELIEKLREGQNRIQTIALIHKNMYQKELYSEINFKEYIEELIQQIKQTHNSNNEIEINYNIQPVLLSLDFTIPLSLIVTEIISNSFKHAFKDQKNGEISIYFEELSPKKHILKITDNGCGFETDQINSNDSIGLDLIQGLTEQIYGEITIDSTINNGTTITITFSSHD